MGPWGGQRAGHSYILGVCVARFDEPRLVTTVDDHDAYPLEFRCQRRGMPSRTFGGTPYYYACEDQDDRSATKRNTS